MEESGGCCTTFRLQSFQKWYFVAKIVLTYYENELEKTEFIFRNMQDKFEISIHLWHIFFRVCLMSTEDFLFDDQIGNQYEKWIQGRQVLRLQDPH